MSDAGILKPIGNFIKDHGVAIFLVVFFVLVIYPEQASERKEWITQITKLEESLDPSKRPITDDQATIILELVTESFVQSIETSMGQLGFGYPVASGFFSTGSGPDFFPPPSFQPMSNRKEDGAIRVFIYGEPYEINKNEKDKKEKTKELYDKYLRATRKQSILVSQQIETSLEKALRSSRFVTSGLRSFFINDATLLEHWESAFNENYDVFYQSLVQSYVDQTEHGFAKDSFLALLEYADAEIPEGMLEVKNYKHPSQVMFDFKASLKAEWKKSLAHADDSTHDSQWMNYKGI
jgi:hypothetical protein